jgi:hypothetical protein
MYKKLWRYPKLESGICVTSVSVYATEWSIVVHPYAAER